MTSDTVETPLVADNLFGRDLEDRPRAAFFYDGP